MSKADVFAGKGSFAARAKARREAIESGNEGQAAEAFGRGEWSDLSVDGVTDNQKMTMDEVDEKGELRKPYGGVPSGGPIGR